MNAKPDVGVKQESEWVDPDDAPELTEEFFAKAETFQGDVFVKRGRGRPPTGNAKELVSLRLDRDVLAKLREAGPGWQSQVSGLLRSALGLDQARGLLTTQEAAIEAANIKRALDQEVAPVVEGGYELVKPGKVLVGAPSSRRSR